MRSLFHFLFIAACGLAASTDVACSSTAVGYLHGGYGHYFVAAVSADNFAHGPDNPHPADVALRVLTG